jgi:hypothetical protein
LGTNAWAPAFGHRLQDQQSVQERGDEGAEHDLVDAVAHKAGDQARAELRGRELQRDQGHREHQAGDGDHRAGDRREHCPRAFRAGREDAAHPRQPGRATA